MLNIIFYKKNQSKFLFKYFKKNLKSFGAMAPWDLQRSATGYGHLKISNILGDLKSFDSYYIFIYYNIIK